MKFDSLFAPLTGPVWLRPMVFLGRMVRFNPVTVAVVAVVLSALGVLEGLGLSILLPLLALIGLETGSKAGGPARAVESIFTALGIPLTLGPVLAVFFTVGMVLILLHAIQQYLLIRSTEQITSQLRCRLFDAASEASWKVLISGRGAHLVNAIVSETARIGVVYGNAMSAFGMGFSFVVYLALAAWVSWQLTLLAAAIGIISMMTLRGLYRSSRRFGRYTSEATNRMQEVLNEHISSAKLLRAFGAGAWSRTTFAKAVDAVAEYLRRNQANSLWVKTSVEPFGLLMIVAMVYYSIEVVRLPAAELMLMLLIVFRLTPRLVALQELFQRITGMLPAYEAVADALHELTRAKEPQGQTAFKNLQREIEFKGVTVRREGHTVLNSVNFKIPVHATIALVGRSGGGKTTLLDVIAGLLNPDSGNVLVDGVSLVELNLDTFRNRIGLVPQESYFFHDTIAANLRIAAPQARDDEIWAALKLAHADEFVATRKEGLAAVIGDQGLRLSGGQRQRLSLARALLRNPDILLLDEATSAIDPETEQIILNTLKDLHGKLTIVLVTHRLSMTVDADMVYTVSQGQVEPWTEEVKEPSGGCA